MSAPRSLFVLLLACALLFTALPGLAQTQREVDDAGRQSDSARRDVEEAAADQIAAEAALLEGIEEYEAVNLALEELAFELAGQRAELIDLEDGARVLRQTVQALAVEAYMSGEDLDLGMRLRDRGVAFEYNPDAVTFHHFNGDLRGHIERTHKYGMSVLPVLTERYPDIEMEHMLVDAASMRIIQNPRYFDVLVTENTFGDILPD